MTRRFVYGPVPSRRLGRSLGVDLVPFKVCSYDCIYCQLGRTTDLTTKRREYVPVDQVLDEVRQRLQDGPRPDVISLAGSGEPTLHARIGDIIAGIKQLTDIPVAVITNGSLLWHPEVRRALMGADLILPSLDAGTPAAFQRVNRPHPEITYERMVEGLVDFSSQFEGEIRLEVFVLAGITDLADEIESIAAIADSLAPARIQLNTVSRPAAEPDAIAVTGPELERLCSRFSGRCEIIAESAPVRAARPASTGGVEDDIVAMLRRRPCTVDGIAEGLALRPNQVLKSLENLCAAGTVRVVRRGDAIFYEAGGR